VLVELDLDFRDDPPSSGPPPAGPTTVAVADPAADGALREAVRSAGSGLPDDLTVDDLVNRASSGIVSRSAATASGFSPAATDMASA
jgi:hypothetical protein